MRDFINITNKFLLKEAEGKPPEVKTKSPKQDYKLPSSDTSSNLPSTKKTSNIDSAMKKVASKDKTSASMNPIYHPDAAKHMRSLLNKVGDEIDTTDTTNAIPTKPTSTPNNLPSTISNALDVAHEKFNPEWHMVKNLPNYVYKGIKELGKQLFGQFTNTPIEEIQSVSTLTNSETEVKMLMKWLQQNGHKKEDAHIDFSKIMPGYTASTQLYSYDSYEFLLVKDFAGYYVYGWPASNLVSKDDDLDQIS